MAPDFLEEIGAERTGRTPQFPEVAEKAVERRRRIGRAHRPARRGVPMDAALPPGSGAPAMGVDRAQILASLQRTPQERFERGVRLARTAALFRHAKVAARIR